MRLIKKLLFFAFFLLNLDLISDLSPLGLRRAIISAFNLVNLRKVDVLSATSGCGLSIDETLGIRLTRAAINPLFFLDFKLSLALSLPVLAVLPPNREVPDAELLNDICN